MGDVTDDRAAWYAARPSVLVSACMLITDLSDRVLMVKPNYWPGWQIPGGGIDEGEPPHQCAEREIAEELGLRIAAGPLLVFDWAPPLGPRPKVMANFIFDGGTITDPGAIRLQAAELDDARFCTWADAEQLMPPNTAARIPAARRARAEQRAIYLPAGA